jgi:predicted Rossmann fold flavoprotein
VILTTGGQSYPGSGTTGDGYRYAQRLGHGLVPPRPALTPLTVEVAWVRELRGITLPDIGLSILEGGKALVRKRGSLLFAHFGLSGPVALDVSRLVTGHPHPSSLSVEIDLVPDIADIQLDEVLRNESLAQAKKQLDVVLAQRVPRRLAEVLLDQAGLPRDRKAAGLSREHRRLLVQAHKRLSIPITGALGFAKAEVTAGGIPLDEVDSRTMASKRVPGLYLAGEILDLDGPIGGYNFQAAWSTGRHAAEHV